jgi:Prokaryotic cytochrome b561
MNGQNMSAQSFGTPTVGRAVADRAVAGARYGLAQIVLHWLVVLLVIEQYATSGAMLRVHGYRPLGRPADPFDLTLHAVHARVGLLIFGLVAVRLLLRIAWGAPEWLTPLPLWRRRLASGVQYALYVVLLGQALTGAIAIYLWWPMSAAHKALFYALVVLFALHLGGAGLSFATRPGETLFRIAALRLGRN